MGEKEERIKLLSRLGRETVIKYGTYDMNNTRPIIQDHPYYQQPQFIPQQEQPYQEPSQEIYENEASYEAEPSISNALVSEDEAAALAAQILGNNFKSGMSQADVDAFLSGIL